MASHSSYPKLSAGLGDVGWQLAFYEVTRLDGNSSYPKLSAGLGDVGWQLAFYESNKTGWQQQLPQT